MQNGIEGNLTETKIILKMLAARIIIHQISSPPVLFTMALKLKQFQVM